MIWFFQRRRARLHYEIRHQTDGPNYELVITFPDGRQEIERYADPGAVTARSISLERSRRRWGSGLRGGAHGLSRSYLIDPARRSRMAPPNDSISTSALPVPRM